MKKPLKFIFATLSCALLLGVTACGATPAVGISPNWYKDTNLSTNITGTKEVLTYEVTFEKGSNSNYAVSYDTGAYVVTLQNVEYKGELAYKLTSTLNITGKYTLGTEEKPFTDKVESECVFRNADRRLSPLYSKKSVHSTSPRADKPTTWDEAVKAYDYTVEITYGADNKTATSVYTDTANTANPTKKDYKLNANALLLDNESLLFAIRSFTLSDAATNVSLVNPYTQKQESVTITKTAQAEGKYTFKDVDANDSEKVEKTITANAVQIKRNDRFTGKIISAYYATLSTTKNYRAVMLKMENPLSYNLGKLVYNLVEADFTDI